MDFLVIVSLITLTAVVFLSAFILDVLSTVKKKLDSMDTELFRMRQHTSILNPTAQVTVQHQKPLRYVGSDELAPDHARPIAAELNYRLDVPHGSTISLQTLYRLKRALSHQARRRLFGED